MRHQVVVLAGLAAICAPAMAIAQQANAVEKTAASQTPASAKTICRSVETIGSRLQKRKMCMTAAQWRDMARNAGDDVNNRTRAPHTEAFGG